jgi:hypothetical protein
MSRRLSQLVLVVTAVWGMALAQPAQAATGVITGTLEKVDSGTKTIAVKSYDGTIKTVKFTSKTSVRGLKDAANGGDLAGKEGGHVIVYTSDKTAHSVTWLGDKTVHATKGTVEDVGKGSKTVAVKTADGTKETFEVADHATVDTGKGVARYSARAAKKGEHVTVYYTEEAGKKIAHGFKRVI